MGLDKSIYSLFGRHVQRAMGALQEAFIGDDIADLPRSHLPHVKDHPLRLFEFFDLRLNAAKEIQRRSQGVDPLFRKGHMCGFTDEFNVKLLRDAKKDPGFGTYCAHR